MTLAVIHPAAVTALLAFVFHGYAADALHAVRGGRPRQARPRPRRIVHLRRVV